MKHHRINQLIEIIRNTKLFGNNPARIYRVYFPVDKKQEYPIMVLTREGGTNVVRGFQNGGQSITLTMTIYSNRLTDIENIFSNVIDLLMNRNQLLIQPDLPNEGYLDDSSLFYQTTQLMLQP